MESNWWVEQPLYNVNDNIHVLYEIIAYKQASRLVQNYLLFIQVIVVNIHETRKN